MRCSPSRSDSARAPVLPVGDPRSAPCDDGHARAARAAYEDAAHAWPVAGRVRSDVVALADARAALNTARLDRAAGRPARVARHVAAARMWTRYARHYARRPAGRPYLPLPSLD